ncbi:serine hydrolase domain-containing protein [Bradyrhizobium sp. CCBAU 51627]|uniref:serine hydrolase domain-containing protein n=1 Tax=Bradyrhizobium sp. CCBAU 51627 TaxID=1325088 RepID=UPI00230545C1|nr:serine hydrolase domain-containing protein [Bradyrhizobium sp. CCBAU 51627]
MNQLPESNDPALERALNPILSNAIAERRVAGAVVLVSRRGVLSYARAIGFADVEARRPMTLDTIFLAASLTKPIVTAAFLSLVDEGTMALDDLVARYLPAFSPKFNNEALPITLRQLLTHTAGLSYGFLQPLDGPYQRLGVSDGVDQPGLSIADELARIVEAGLFFPPGRAWVYSVGMDVLGAAIESATGKSLPQVVAERVTSRLGMSDSGFAVVDPSRLATPYADGRPPVRMGKTHLLPFAGLSGIRFEPDRIFDQTSFASGGGGMACTASDFLAFLEAIRNGGGAVVAPDTAREMMKNQTGSHLIVIRGPGWGFGFGGAVLTHPTVAGLKLPGGLWSWGGVYGHSWAVDPEREVSYVLMTNTAVEGMNGQLSMELMAAALAS